MYLLAFAESIQLFPDGTLFIHIALILLMIWVLNRTLFKPINRVIAARQKFRGGHASEADEILAQVAEKQKTYNREILEARGEGYELVEKERTAAVELRQQRISEARANAARMLETEKQQLHQQAEQARAAIAEEADRLADKISSNILKVKSYGAG